jgi:hypothetical protein
MPPKFTPRAPQVGRYWPGKPLKDDEELSSDDDDDDDEEEEEEEEEPVQVTEKVENMHTRVAVATAKLVTTTKTSSLAKQGPYMESEEEESLVSESEEEEIAQPEERTSIVRPSRRRAVGDFIAVDQINLEDEEEVRLISNHSMVNV